MPHRNKGVKGRRGELLVGRFSLPLVWIPQRYFPSFVWELTQGSGQMSSFQLHGAFPASRQPPELKAA